MQPAVKIMKEMDSDRSICNGCLTSGRELKVLGEYREIYRRICPNRVWRTKSIEFCWECRATLRKVKEFQEKVENAQNLLNSYYSYNILENLPSLSSLMPTETEISEYCESSECNEEENDVNDEENIGLKVDPEITQENDMDYDSIDDNENFNNDYDCDSVEEIKEEYLTLDTLLTQQKDITVEKTEVSPKSKKTKKPKHYRIIKRQAFKDVVKKVQINQKDIGIWVKRERNTNYYKNLNKKCERCVSKILVNLEDHNKLFHIKTKDKTVRCNVCEKYFTSKEYYIHKPMHLYYYFCKICEYKCYNRYNMEEHLGEHKTVVQCSYCTATFVNRRQFNVHLHKLHEWFICDYCDKKCRKLDALEGHITRKHMPIKCLECDIVFHTKGALDKHRTIRHIIDRTEEAYCVQCDRQFNNIWLLRRHVKNDMPHIAEWTKSVPTKPRIRKPAQCPSCHKMYSRRNFMLDHYRLVHEKRPKYYCDQCEKGFLNSAKWRDHQIHQHEGRDRVKNYICGFCGGQFINNVSLTRHMRTHTGDRPYRCPHCAANFTQKAAMNIHVRSIHTLAADRPYECPHCDAYFTQKNALTIHVRSRHEPKKAKGGEGSIGATVRKNNTVVLKYY